MKTDKLILLSALLWTCLVLKIKQIASDWLRKTVNYWCVFDNIFKGWKKKSLTLGTCLLEVMQSTFEWNYETHVGSTCGAKCYSIVFSGLSGCTLHGGGQHEQGWADHHEQGWAGQHEQCWVDQHEQRWAGQHEIRTRVSVLPLIPKCRQAGRKYRGFLTCLFILKSKDEHIFEISEIWL